MIQRHTPWSFSWARYLAQYRCGDTPMGDVLDGIEDDISIIFDRDYWRRLLLLFRDYSVSKKQMLNALKEAGVVGGNE